MKKPLFILMSLMVILIIILIIICVFSKTSLNLTKDIKMATDKTIEINSAVYSYLDFENTDEFKNATRGLIDAPEELELKDENGQIIWSQKAYSFVKNYKKAPDTVNPSLWENTKNNTQYGLFKVIDGIYQVRGYDMANLTLIEGNEGWIVFDPLMSVECTKAAMQLVEKNLGKKPISAVIVSHPHVDHYGGIEGIILPDEVSDSSLSIDEQLQSGRIPVIVPEGFTEHAVSENVYAGKAMQRRAAYQYGNYLDKSINGSLAMGIGMDQSKGLISFINPTYEIKKTGEKIIIDGIEIEFQLTPGTEAPAEMNAWFPQKNALWVAENCTGTLHNLYTLRGAQVRDGNEWAHYINEAVSLYGDKVEVTFQSHNWPHWENKNVNEYLVNTAAVYKFINDQTLTYINQGYTSNEISNMIKLPDALAKVWYTRQYYGTVAHDSKAVYQKYMGWYDANPVHLNPLTPTDSAKKWVEYLGDTSKVLKMAKEDFDAGEYQWVAEITSVLVYADPNNIEARLLCADALEQLGYQAESGTWRNVYLSGALELRNGNVAHSTQHASNTFELERNMTAKMLFDYFGIILDKQAMSNEDFYVNIDLIDTNEKYSLRFKNGAILQYDKQIDNPELTLKCKKNALFLLIEKNADSISQAIEISGDKNKFELILNNLNQIKFDQPGDFNIIEP